MKKIGILTVCLAILAFLLPSCGSSMSENEIRALYQSLLEPAAELNEIYYGEGLPFERDDEMMAALLGVEGGAESLHVSYMPVSKEAAYQSEEELRKATEEIFSPEMCEYLFDLAFSGLSTEDDQTVSFARYIEKSGVLTVRMDLADEALPMGRTFDYAGMKILQSGAKRIRAEFPSQIEGKESVSVKITIVKTENGWRLDSPTY